jgi:hypothetical protein
MKRQLATWNPLCLHVPMIRTVKTQRMATLATGGLMLAISVMGLSAQAQTPCVNGLPIATIVNSGTAGYTCQLGGLTYNFANNISELNMPNQNGVVDFFDSPTTQKITFRNLFFQGLAEFSYGITSTTDTVTSIVQSYTQNISSPPPLLSDVFATVPSTIVSVIASLETDGGSPSDPHLTSLIHTINKTPIPGPLPVMGTAFALGFSRKLRGRVQQAAGKGHLSSRTSVL